MFDLASQTKIKGVVRFRPFPVATGREELVGRHSGKKKGGEDVDLSFGPA